MLDLVSFRQVSLSQLQETDLKSVNMNIIESYYLVTETNIHLQVI